MSSLLPMKHVSAIAANLALAFAIAHVSDIRFNTEDTNFTVLDKEPLSAAECDGTFMSREITTDKGTFNVVNNVTSPADGCALYKELTIGENYNAVAGGTRIALEHISRNPVIHALTPAKP